MQSSGFRFEGVGFRVLVSQCRLGYSVSPLAMLTNWYRKPVSYTMYLLISFCKKTPPNDLQLHTFISNSKQVVDDHVGELTVKN